MKVSSQTSKHENIDDEIQVSKFIQSLRKQYKQVVGEQHVANASPENILEHIVSYYEDIIACMPGNVYWLDKNGVTLGCNQNVLEMFGFRAVSEFKGMTFEDMGRVGNWSKEAEQKFKRDTLEVVETGRAKLNLEEPPIPHSNGRSIYFLSSRVPLFDHQGKVIGVVGISIDITERKVMEESLRKAKEAAELASQAKIEFLENMRHDIRTPLIGIVGFSDIIKVESDSPKIKEYADNLVASSHALLELLNEVLEAIKVASGEIPILKRKFDFKNRLLNVIKLNQSKAKQKSLILTLNHDEAIPRYLVGDSTRVHRIVLELVTNALNFTEKGAVKVTTQLAKRNERDLIIKVIVEDTGIGISLDKQQEIFVQFKRLTPSYEGIYKGAGLGLAIIRQFVDELQGEIYVESKPQQGAKFTCVFPLKEALLDEELGSDTDMLDDVSQVLNGHLSSTTAAQLIKENEAANDNLANSRVLLVEDQLMAAKVAKIILTNLDCEVDMAATGEAAVELARINRYDLIFMDVGLPDMSGNEVTKRIRLFEWDKEHPVPIIALTAHVDIKNKQECIEAGMNAVLTKPLVSEKARDILNAFIPGHSRATEAITNEIIDDQAHLLTLHGNVIDYKLALKTVGGNKQLIDELLQVLLESFPEELTTLEKCYNQFDWDGIRAVAHKLRGGTNYCGTIRLREACARLENYLATDYRELAPALYQQLLEEIEMVKKYLTKVKRF